MPRAAAPPLDVDRLIDDRRTRIIVCCGSGGVGKTTAAAALGLRAAERGRHVVVITVDPARRLAQSMGLSSLDNTPRPVPGVATAGPRRDPGAGQDEAGEGGSLHAMMLDMKRRPTPIRTGRRRSWRTPFTSHCRRASPAPRSTWPWRSSASFAALTSGT